MSQHSSWLCHLRWAPASPRVGVGESAPSYLLLHPLVHVTPPEVRIFSSPGATACACSCFVLILSGAVGDARLGTGLAMCSLCFWVHCVFVFTVFLCSLYFFFPSSPPSAERPFLYCAVVDMLYYYPQWCLHACSACVAFVASWAVQGVCNLLHGTVPFFVLVMSLHLRTSETWRAGV